jgi:hypothetical protein
MHKTKQRIRIRKKQELLHHDRHHEDIDQQRPSIAVAAAPDASVASSISRPQADGNCPTRHGPLGGERTRPQYGGSPSDCAVLSYQGGKQTD